MYNRKSFLYVFAFTESKLLSIKLRTLSIGSWSALVCTDEGLNLERQCCVHLTHGESSEGRMEQALNPAEVKYVRVRDKKEVHVHVYTIYALNDLLYLHISMYRVFTHHQTCNVVRFANVT